MKILVINCGSSTIKFQLIEMETNEVIAKGRCDQVGYDTSNIIYKNLVDKKEEVEVKELDGEKSIIFEVKVAEGDMGKIIGKQGRLAKSIRTVIKAVANKEQKRVSVEFIG